MRADLRFGSKMCADSFDSSLLMTNADLFLGSWADQCCGRAPAHAQPRHLEIVAPNFLLRL